MDPLTTLAFAIRSNPGVYALLVGSGVSTGAGIPTGWAILEDLIRRLAHAQKGEIPDGQDPAKWYVENYGEDADYSSVLRQLGRTQAERQALIRRYIDPSDQERTEGLKVATQAHHAIAGLVRGGFVRVIITTNFDRLIEQALDSAGVEYDIVANSDQVRGARPPIHSPCMIVKLHGDYRDARILNTADELDVYDPDLEALLDRVLEDHGLVISGWSAEWDTALRSALSRQKSRRYTTYWATRGPLAGEAEQLAKARQAEIIEIESADRFFADLADRVQALVDFDRPHPLTMGAGVAMLKRYLPDPSQRIRLHDLVMDEAERVHETLSDSHFPMQDPGYNDDTWRSYLLNRLQRYRAAIERLLSLIVVGCEWSRGEEQDALWGRALERVANHSSTHSGSAVLIATRNYPALLCMYGGGIAAVHTGNYGALRALTVDQEYEDLNERVPMIAGLHLFKVFEQEFAQQALHEGNQRRFTPVSDHLHEVLRDPLREVIRSDSQFTESFDRLEYMLGLILTDLSERAKQDGPWIPGPWYGSAIWRFRHGRRRAPWAVVPHEYEESDEWPPLKAGLFGGSKQRVDQAMGTLNEALENRSARLF